VATKARATGSKARSQATGRRRRRGADVEEALSTPTESATAKPAKKAAPKKAAPKKPAAKKAAPKRAAAKSATPVKAAPKKVSAKKPAAKTVAPKKAAAKRSPAKKASSPVKWGGLSASDLLEFYRFTYLSRRLDDREINMKKKNQIYFQISGAGHELPLIAAGRLLKAGYDWFFPYYRDRALCLTIGMTPTEVLMQGTGAEADPNSHGRQMPCHWGHKELNIPAVSSCTGTQFLHAVGAAQTKKICDAVDGLSNGDIEYYDDEIMYVSSGDGTTSQGEFWESLNTACNEQLPVLYMIEDNGYAISVPVEVQTPGGSISKLVSSFPGIKIVEFDGCDVVATHLGVKEAIDHIRSGKGPALVHAHVVRPYSHSLSDAETMYRPKSELEEDARRDPFHSLPAFILAEGAATEAQLQEIRDELDAEVLAAADAAVASPPPLPETALTHVYSEDVDPTSHDFDTEHVPEFTGNDMTMVDLINATLSAEMASNPRIVVFGEDVADVSREEYIEDVKGKGGVFKATAGLQRSHGGARVFNSPLAEANIIGRAIGMALRGLRPVVEIQFFDYIWPAYMQLRNELSNYRWRSAGDFSTPVVVRVPIGGYLTGGAPYHSQSGEVLFTHIPGLRVIMPSNARDAAGLLRTAMRCDDPVMFLEPKHLYRQTYNKSQNPGDDFMIPFGKAATVREGTDVTVITYGCLVQRTVKAAREAEKQGIDVEIIDLRSLSPYDWDAIVESVKKTNKVIVSHEDHLAWGYAAEIAARISDELFEYLDGPVRRVCGKDSFVAYAPVLEDEILPQVDDVLSAIVDLHAY
jgi:2-oxoisovalerate dehydrogenase E1 component